MVWRILIVFALIGWWGVMGPAGAQTSVGAGGLDATDLKEQIIGLREYLEEANKNLTENNARVQQEIDNAKNAMAIIDESIERMKGIAARFDSDGDIRKFMVTAEQLARERAKKYGASTNSALKQVAPRFQELAKVFLEQQYTAEELVDEALTQIRRLEENREGAAALIEIGALTEAKAILDDSLKRFGKVIEKATEVADETEVQTTQGTSF